MNPTLSPGSMPAATRPFASSDHLPVELGRCDVAPSVAVRDGEQRQLRRRLHSIDQEVGDIRLRVSGDDRGDFELNHGNSFGTGQVLG